MLFRSVRTALPLKRKLPVLVSRYSEYLSSIVSCLGGGPCVSLSPFICDNLKSGFFLGAGLLDVGLEPGNPPGSLMPRFSARDGGFATPARGTAGAETKLGMPGFPTGIRKLAGMPPGPAIAPPGEAGFCAPRGGPPETPGDMMGDLPDAPFGGGAPCRPR